jgi:predicted Zn-dependent protease
VTGGSPAELADRALAMVGDGVDAAVTVTHIRQGLTRFANSFIHQNVGDERTTVTVEVVLHGRPATSSTTRVDDDGLRRVVAAARHAASRQPVDEGWPGLAPPTPATEAVDARYDPATAGAGPGERAAVVASFVAAGAGLQGAGYCETTGVHAAFANSRGHTIASSTTTATIDGIHRCQGADGCGSAMSSRLAGIDGGAAGAAAAETARRGAAPEELAPGRYEVVLEPRCVAYMLDFFTFYGFNAKALLEGRSFVSPGERQLDAALSYWDDATDPRAVGTGFDAEGTPKRRTSLVEEGRVVGLTHDRRTAARADAGGHSTGHAIPGGGALGAVATNTFLSASDPTPGEKLIAGVERGLLVKDFWYTRVLDPKTLVVTGLTRNGVFLVEDGRIGSAVANLRFTQTPVAAFGPGQVLGVGDDARWAPGGLHISWHHAPSLRLASWNFTGNAAG